MKGGERRQKGNICVSKMLLKGPHEERTEGRKRRRGRKQTKRQADRREKEMQRAGSSPGSPLTSLRGSVSKARHLPKTLPAPSVKRPRKHIYYTEFFSSLCILKLQHIIQKMHHYSLTTLSRETRCEANSNQWPTSPLTKCQGTLACSRCHFHLSAQHLHVNRAADRPRKVREQRVGAAGRPPLTSALLSVLAKTSVSCYGSPWTDPYCSEAASTHNLFICSFICYPLFIPYSSNIYLPF